MDENIVKCEIILDRIFYPKNVRKVEAGEYAIFTGTIVKNIDNAPDTKNIKLKGNVPLLEYATTYKVFAKLAEHHEIYGDTYEIIYISKKIDISSREKQMEFLSNVLPESTVDRLFEQYDDVLTLLEDRDIESLCKVKGIKEASAQRIIDEYNSTKDYSSMYTELGKLGLTYNLIKTITEYYKSPDVAVDVIKKNPYDLVKLDGIGFKKADEIGMKMGIGKFDCRRIKEFLLYTLSEQGEMGKSYLHYQELMKILYDTLGFVPEECVMKTAQMMVENKDVVVLNDGENIALARYYNLEKNIKHELIRLLNNEHDNRNPEDIETYIPKDFKIENAEESIVEVEKEQGYTFTEEQREALYTCLNNQVIAITGGAGVGKTSTANGICRIFKDYEILAVALSGKAAVRITEATGLPASTIHRGLQWTAGHFLYDKYNKAPFDIVLIDEATMINGTLFLSLLEAIPSGAKVIIMGDVQQLTSIGNCQVFSDILNSNVIPTVRLTKPHRQALRSGIIPTSIKVANQEQLFDNNFEGSQIIGELQDMELNITKDKGDLSDFVVEKFVQEYNKISEIEEVQVIAPLKTKGNISCYTLNTKIQQFYNPISEDDDTFEVVISKTKEDKKSYKIKVGDKVINTKNNYKSLNVDGDICPIYNGNIGIVKNITSKGCIVDFIGIGEIFLNSQGIKNLELGYAISIHKSQGSGFKSTIIALDNSSYIMNNAELLYTAITRAKKYCILVANNQAVRMAIKKKEINTKQTFLKDMLLGNIE